MAVNQRNVFRQNMQELLEVVEDCAVRGRLLPCLTLLYSAIDVLGSLEKKENEGVKKTFVRWVDQYMLSTHPLPCSALELYGARCGIVHTFTPHSTLSRKHREIIYAWGKADVTKLSEASLRLGRGEVALHVHDLIAAFKSGVSAYLKDVASDPQREKHFKATIGLWFTMIDRNHVSNFLAVSTLEDRIVSDPQICGGELVFRGTRVTLRTVLASLATGDSTEKIIADFPSLKPEDIQAAIAFTAASA